MIGYSGSPRRIVSAWALLAVAAGLLPSGALADDERVRVWRGECCEQTTQRRGNAACEDEHVIKACCVRKSELCRAGCDTGSERRGMREVCERLCKSHGLACMDGGPIASRSAEDDGPP